MSKRPRRNHAPAFKAKVALDELRGLNNGIFFSDGFFRRFFRERILIPADQSVRNQVKDL